MLKMVFETLSVKPIRMPSEEEVEQICVEKKFVDLTSTDFDHKLSSDVSAHMKKCFEETKGIEKPDVHFLWMGLAHFFESDHCQFGIIPDWSGPKLVEKLIEDAFNSDLSEDDIVTTTVVSPLKKGSKEVSFKLESPKEGDVIIWESNGSNRNLTEQLRRSREVRLPSEKAGFSSS